jgi:thiol-disulfide isomerase/thioredoxin
MKPKIIMGLCLAVALLVGAGASAQSNKFVMTGNLSLQKMDATITLDYVLNGKPVKDTAIIKNGVFEFRGELDCAVFAHMSYISDEQSKGGDGFLMDQMRFFLEPGSTTINGERLRNAVITGGTNQKLYTEYNAIIEPIKKSQQDIYSKFRDKTPTAEEIAEAKKSYEEGNTKIYNLTLDFILKNPTAYASLVLIRNIVGYADYVKVDATLNSMSPELKAMKEWQLLNNKVKGALETSTGHKFSDFTKKDINGNDFTLSSIRGKYVILDFWGSWCGPCRQSHPHLKEIYSKYKAKGLEIIGIDCEKKKDLAQCEELWKKAVKEDGMTWIQVLNNYDIEKVDLPKIYGIQGFPTKILLDKEGKIFFRIMGSDPEKLDQKLKELIGE